MNQDSKESENIQILQEKIRKGLSEIEYGNNWLDEYDQWKKKDENQFDSTLDVNNPLDLENVGNRNCFDLTNPADTLDLDIYCMSIFLSENLLKYTKQAFKDLRREKNRYNKQKIIEQYFELINEISQNQNLSYCIVILYKFAEMQKVLFGNRSSDFYVSFFSLKENLRKRSPESIFLLFSYWRITKSQNYLEDLISAIIDYIQTYFYNSDEDPDMHLYYPLEKETVIIKLVVISHWLEHIAFHTNGIFEKYKELNWLKPTDKLVDEIVITNQISKYKMNLYRRFFSEDDIETVQKKAICMHGYGIWIRTVDVIYIVCDIFQILYRFTDEELNDLNTTRTAILEGYDNMIKIRDFYTRSVFFHQVFYKLERHYLDSDIMNALEDDAELFSESVDHTINFVEAIAEDDIEALLQTKQKYIARLSDYISEEQQEKLDEITQQVAEKVKNSIQKLNIYDELYQAVSNEFLPYANILVQYPQIFSSLVSAEYLYQQYVENHQPNNRFDYSCISILYYMALEDFINKLIYSPYMNEVLSTIQIYDNNPNRDSEWRSSGYRNYVSSYKEFWDFHNGTFKRTCELGPLGYLLESISSESRFESFIVTRYGNVDILKLSNYGTSLKNVSPRRNDAAHGGNYLTYQDVMTDKANVYNTAVSAYKGLIIELLELLFSNQS